MSLFVTEDINRFIVKTPAVLVTGSPRIFKRTTAVTLLIIIVSMPVQGYKKNTPDRRVIPSPAIEYHDDGVITAHSFWEIDPI